MIIQTLIPGRTEPIRTPPPALWELSQIILVQELALVAHDTQAPDEMLADRINLFLFPRMKRLRRRRDKVCRRGHGMAFQACGGAGGTPLW